MYSICLIVSVVFEIQKKLFFKVNVNSVINKFFLYNCIDVVL